MPLSPDGWHVNLQSQDGKELIALVATTII